MLPPFLLLSFDFFLLFHLLLVLVYKCVCAHARAGMHATYVLGSMHDVVGKCRGIDNHGNSCVLTWTQVGRLTRQAL